FTNTHTVNYDLLTATGQPDNYSLSLHDALPIWAGACCATNATISSYTFGYSTWKERSSSSHFMVFRPRRWELEDRSFQVLYPKVDRKSTRLNSSHVSNSYAVFCLNKIK